MPIGRVPYSAAMGIDSARGGPILGPGIAPYMAYELDPPRSLTQYILVSGSYAEMDPAVLTEKTDRLSGTSRTFLTMAVAPAGRPAAYPMKRALRDCRFASLPYEMVQSLPWLDELLTLDRRGLCELRDEDEEDEA